MRNEDFLFNLHQVFVRGNPHHRQTGKTTAVIYQVIGQIWAGDMKNIVVLVANNRSGSFFTKELERELQLNHIILKRRVGNQYANSLCVLFNGTEFNIRVVPMVERHTLRGLRAAMFADDDIDFARNQADFSMLTEC